MTAAMIILAGRQAGRQADKSGLFGLHKRI